MPNEDQGSPAPVDSGTPAPAPVEQTPTPVSDAPVSDTALFEGLGEDFDDMSVELPEPEAVPAKTAEPPKPEAAAAAAPVPSAQPAAKAPEPPKPEPPKAPEGQQAKTDAPSPPPAGPQGLVEQLSQHRNDILEDLGKTRFAWDKGEEQQFRAALEEDAAEALVTWVPKMMSRLYYESVTATLKHINQFVPTLVANYNSLQEQQKAAEEQFFKQFPGLNKKAHWNDIVSFSKGFGAQPGISQEDLLAMVGAAVMAKHKLSGLPTQQNGAAPRKSAAQPFVPAQSGTGGPAKVTTEVENPFEGLGGNYDE